MERQPDAQQNKPDGIDPVALGGAECKLKGMVVDAISPYFVSDALILRTLKLAAMYDHVMVYADIRAIAGFFSMICKATNTRPEYNEQHEDFPVAGNL